MKRFLITVLLSGLFAVSAFGGEIPSVPVNAPPPDDPSAPTAPGDVPSVGFTQQVTESALTLIQLALGGVV